MTRASADQASPAYQARDVMVPSFDGAEIFVHFFPAEGLQPGQRAPTVLSGHGWAGRGDADPSSDPPTPGRIGNGALRRAGYNVVTWDSRGFGLSDGVVQVNAPDAEAIDIMALIDFVAEQPEALLDCGGDPRVGMVGYSYGGGIQLTSSGIGEDRLDALVPDISWHSLRSSLYPDKTPLTGWTNILLNAGVPAANAHGEGLDPHITAAGDEARTTGKISDENVRWFESRGPGPLVEEIRVPTFFTQGTVDTLFRLDEAIANFGALRANGVPVKMLWYCGGHGACTTRGGVGTDPEHVKNAVLAWLARHLKRDTSVDTGPRFEWLADDGVWRGARDYPLEEDAPLVGTRTGGALTLRVTAEDGTSIMAVPAAEAVNIPIAAPSAPAQVVGSPRFSLDYSGLGTEIETQVFAQIVDRNDNVVLGNQATPIPVILDGQVRTITRSLEAVAASLTPESRLELQIVNASDLFARQRSAGALNVLSARVELPVGNAERTPDRVIVRADLGISRAPDGRIESARVLVRTSRPITRVRVRLYDEASRIVATAPQTQRIHSEATVRLRVWTRLAPGRYRVVVSHAEGELARWVDILPAP